VEAEIQCGNEIEINYKLTKKSWHFFTNFIDNKIIKIMSDKTFDFKPLLDNIKSILQQTWDEEKPELEQISNEYLTGAQERFTDLSNKLAADGDTYFFIERLKDEPTIIATQLLSLEVIAKVQAQESLGKIWQTVYDFCVKLLSELIYKYKP